GHPDASGAIEPAQNGYTGNDYGANEYTQADYAQDEYGQGGYEQGGYDQTGYEQGDYEQGDYDQNGYHDQQPSESTAQYKARRHRPSANDTNVGTLADFANMPGYDRSQNNW
ncbi:MAG TPA: hypothetical protein VN408_27285, partial [Actinoplanes sp.]|nr:hypothetical protein [Actinoplanes sp.]